MKTLTGNRLEDGEAVFWRQGEWVERFAEAELFEDAAAAEAAEGRPSPRSRWWSILI